MPDPQPAGKWYHGLVPVFLGLFLMGPLAFPVLWKSPRFNLFWKVLLTFLVLAVTVWMIQASAGAVNILLAQIKQIQEAGG
ncbi:MAG TPA: hypothetical protein VJC08_05770 [bacterium]|nr:hypothetical protein [bacterium]